MSDKENKGKEDNKSYLNPDFLEFKKRTKLYKVYEKLDENEKAWSDKVLSDLTTNLGVALGIVAEALQDPEQRREILKKMNRKDDTES